MLWWRSFRCTCILAYVAIIVLWTPVASGARKKQAVHSHARMETLQQISQASTQHIIGERLTALGFKSALRPIL